MTYTFNISIVTVHDVRRCETIRRRTPQQTFESNFFFKKKEKKLCTL